MTLLTQKEVAERIVAYDGKESLLSLSVKIFGEPKYIQKVSRSFFKPQPNVDSAIIVIDDISKKRLRHLNQKEFFDLIHLGFAHKRKQLLPNLSSVYNREKVIEAFKKTGLEAKVRAEDIPLESWLKLYKIISK